MSDRIAAFYVTLHGEVQDVGLRKRIRDGARKKNLAGWVRNRKAGHVQLHVEGPEREARQLIADLQTGAVAADIDDLIVTRIEPSGYEDFTVATVEDAQRIAPALVRAALGRAKRLEAEYADLSIISIDSLKHPVKDQSDLADLMKRIPNRFLGEPFLQRQKIMGFKLTDAACSFASESWEHHAFQTALSRCIGYTPENILNDKGNGKAFAEKIGLKVPITYQRDVPFSEIDLKPGLVIKPVRAANARGVFSIDSKGKIFSLGSRKILESLDELKKEAINSIRDIYRGDRWISEEFIQGSDGIPEDIKAYCFYGKSRLFLEVDRNGAKRKYCWWLRSGESVQTGKYEEEEFLGSGISRQHVELAEKISLRIPAPFIRIDFLKSKDGLVFGEFTPKPGNFQGFDAETDAWLGKEFAEARGRLVADLMKRKAFTDFDAFVVSLKTARTVGKS